MPSLTINIWTIFGAVMIVMLFVLQWFGRLPKADAVHDGITLLNSKGGNIVVLTLMSMWFFAHSVKLFYYTLDQVQRGTLQENNAFALMGLQFVTSSAFGGAFGALLKTMTATDTPAPVITPAPVTTPAEVKASETTKDSNNQG